MSMLHWNDFVLRLGAAVLAGAMIGLERQWRSRGAGLRTNTLVAAGVAMFVLIAAMTPHESSPTRITSYVVRGVGFLGAGVIISDGVSVRGINTAATLWCAAAAGALAGSGFVWQAGVATAAVLTVNIVLRPLGRRNDHQIEAAAGRLGLEPAVTAVRWKAIENGGQGSLRGGGAIDT
jgi:putative Mg2+ transporter-C (MgtC) family protein